MTADHWALLMFAATFLAGTLSTWNLYLIHRDETSPRNRITRAFVIVALVVTVAAGYFGALATRRLLDFPPLPGAAAISLVMASAVLLIPVFLLVTVRQIRGMR